jgi:hypothetical protein
MVPIDTVARSCCGLPIATLKLVAAFNSSSAGCMARWPMVESRTPPGTRSKSSQPISASRAGDAVGDGGLGGIQPIGGGAKAAEPGHPDECFDETQVHGMSPPFRRYSQSRAVSTRFFAIRQVPP